ncbi:MAG: phosphoribosylformylglycinamidine cyclo-ligase [Oscillospiraceae bacterium]|jgi:phosphoribosylformylglycinamidine cyclo-ligase|nr:phosphoribosylformylglycinamidine cyclo-ligase [Oscillospiraceae bacterium]
MKSFSESYSKAGVDITAGYDSVEKFKDYVKSTFTPEVIGGIGGFGGMIAPNLTGIAEPILVSGTDGVGTKIRLAQLAGIHGTIGIDCVAMCVNDIICCGARPMFFLDYIAMGKNVPDRTAEIVKGVAEGCSQAGAALVGGECAEHPGLMADDDYDLAGFAVGLADKSKMIDGSKIQEGDLLVALPSSGLHSNGFSLVRKVFDIENLDPASALMTELLTPTKIYVSELSSLMSNLEVRGVSHITGGGLIENVPRMLPDGIKAVIDTKTWTPPEIFLKLQAAGDIPQRDMYNTFNMGVGMVLAVPAQSNVSGLNVIGVCEHGEGVELKW